MSRVLIVDDHAIVRQGLRHLVENSPGLTVVGEAADFQTAAELLRTTQPDVAVLDLNLGQTSGLDLVRLCRAQSPPVGAVVLTMHREQSTFEAAMHRGALAYVLKENATEEILLAIRSVAAGGFFLSSSLKEFLGRPPESTEVLENSPQLRTLTPTERRVLRLIGNNRTSKEIAHELCISPRTVESHRASICDRLKLRGAQVLLRFALEHRQEL